MVHTSLSEPPKRAALIDRLLPILILFFAAAAIVLARYRRRQSSRHRHPLQLARSAAADDRRVRAHADLHGAAPRRRGQRAQVDRRSEREGGAVAGRRAQPLRLPPRHEDERARRRRRRFACGYVSQAWLWVNGNLIVDQPIAREVPWPNADFTFAPLGYRGSLDGGGIVPTYAPRTAASDGVVDLSFGECGPFLVVPLLAGLMVWVTYKIGERVSASRHIGLAAAVLMASSPAFLFMSLSPMSDVPVASLFCCAVLAALTPMRGRAFITGLLVGVAVLVRPNMAPMAAVFAGYLASQETNWRDRLIALIAFGVGCLPVGDHGGDRSYEAVWRAVEVGLRRFQLVVCVVPFLWTNVRQYGTWFVETQTPASLLFVVPFLVIWKLPAEQRPKVTFLGAFAAGVWLCYLFYIPFDAWWYLRFLLSSFPPLLVLDGVRLDSWRCAGWAADSAPSC